MLTETQKINCNLLANHLEFNVTDEKYNSVSWINDNTGEACAFGHAALAGIGGLTTRLDLNAAGYRVPQLITDDGDMMYNQHKACNYIFGDWAYEVFIDDAEDRMETVEYLRQKAAE